MLKLSKISFLLKDDKFISVLVLSIGFMLIRFGSETTCIIAQTVLNGVKDDDPSFTGNAYVALCIVYGVFAIGSLVAPSFVAVAGPKHTMVVSAFGYVFFIASFFKPITWVLYFTSAVCGAGAAILWTAEGNYLTLCSTTKSISRNAGVFWAINQCCYIAGNLLIYFQFSGKTSINEDTRIATFSVLVSVSIAGVFLLGLLKNRRDNDITEAIDEYDGNKHPPSNSVDTGTESQKESIQAKAKTAAKDIFKIFFTPTMLLLSVTSVYAGIEQSFWNGVFPTAIGNTLGFGSNAKSLVGLMGIFTGVGGVIGGTVFGLLGSKTSKIGRSAIVFLGLIVHAACYVLVYLNLPDESIYKETYKVSVFQPPSPTIAIISTVLLGFGDACYQTQLISMFGSIYKENSAPAFATFKFMESGASAISFVSSSYVGILVETSVLLGMATLGFVTFFAADMKNRKVLQEKCKTDNGDSPVS